MYILNKQEEALLKTIVKNARIDYFRKNKHIFEETSIEEKVLYSEDNMEKELENKLDKEVQADKFGSVFKDENLSKIAKALTYDEKLVLSLYFIENKSDEEIGRILFMTRSGANKKRLRALDKIRKECKKRGIHYV